MALLLMVAGLGCERKESDSIRVLPTKVWGEALDRTLLHLAPNWKVAERLITRGADVNGKDSFGMTLLHTAVQASRKEIVELLLKHGAKE